jgi:uncharacterized damage-inducible protein DinB/predicted RNase H-like HicB family nuclease
MARYAVYLETHDDGRCMVHVPALPGCITRELTRDEALRRLPDAVRDYCAWLRRHGEPAPSDDEPVEFDIAGESTGYGPFDPRSAAALFSPDREPVTPEQMEDHFRLMAHSRADLLALVRDLPDEVLDWQPEPESFTIRRLLRHVGNAEEWYVSRLVPAETLPPEWEHDEGLPILEFLEMERRTALARMRQLTGEERAEVHYPTGWTDHPEEPWTARKALRRFLEHEREHTAQAREILAAWRRRLLAHLAAERAGLLGQLIGLNERTLTQSPVAEAWTAKDLLAHVAAWDAANVERLELILAGREQDIVGVDLDERNAALYAERRDWPLQRALDACTQARADFLAALVRLSDAEMHRSRHLSWGERSVRQWTEWRARHDAAHAADLAAWREAQPLKGQSGPKAVLLAALAAARQELLAAAALVPDRDRASRLVCGVWALKDVLGHVADWEWVGVEGLRQMAAGQPPEIGNIADIDAWNQAHYEARRDQPWEDVWADLHAAREAMLEVLEGMGQTDLSRPFKFPWGPEDTAYQWLSVYLAHDREHAQGLREALAPAGS